MTEDPVVHSILETSRRELLDLSTRNRLLNTPRTLTRSGRLEIVDEKSAEVFRRLVVDLKPMSFLAIPDDHSVENPEQSSNLFLQPDEDGTEGNGQAARHRDDKLQTSLTSEQLQKRLLKLSYDAKTYEEEQGVNILFVAMGFLKWYEASNSDRARFAPSGGNRQPWTFVAVTEPERRGWILAARRGVGGVLDQQPQMRRNSMGRSS